LVIPIDILFLPPLGQNARVCLSFAFCFSLSARCGYEFFDCSIPARDGADAALGFRFLPLFFQAGIAMGRGNLALLFAVQFADLC
jgi:hypothetical protein